MKPKLSNQTDETDGVWVYSWVDPPFKHSTVLMHAVLCWRPGSTGASGPPQPVEEPEIRIEAAQCHCSSALFDRMKPGPDVVLIDPPPPPK